MEFMVTECCFIGHMINQNGITPQPSKFVDIVTFKTPSNDNELRTFFGIAAFSRKFVKNFSHWAAPL